MDKLIIQVTKTADGRQDYVQILSADGWMLNIVLIADIIEVKDSRATEATESTGETDAQS